MKRLVVALPVALLAVGAAVAEPRHPHGAPYAGEQGRDIKSLSPDDIAELKRGGGWGLAKAAELNGVPGPAHLLELKDAIPLEDEQISAISELYDRMRAQAVEQGERLIELERELEDHFRRGTITDDILRSSLDAIMEAREELRYIHLATHLRTPEILTPQQIARYNALRGYADPDPCSAAPEGHDAEMWRRHNGC